MICEWMYISLGEYGSLLNVDNKKSSLCTIYK